MVTILLGVGVAVPAAAAETRVVSGWVRIDGDDDITSNITFNLSDPDDHDLLNWNQTVEPFMDNASLDGAFTGGYLPPSYLEVANASEEKIIVCGVVRFKSTWIMSGSSESWWRVPIEGIDNGTYANLTLWHLGSADVVDPDLNGVPNNGSHPVKVFDEPFVMDDSLLNRTFRYWNGTAWDRSFNSTWVRVYAPIHSDESYFVRWVIHLNSTLPYMVRFQQVDVGDDYIYQSWVIWPHNSTSLELEADLDHAVLHTHGLGSAVSGINLPFHQTVLWEEDWTGVDGESIYTYDDDWDFHSGDDDPPREIDDDNPNVGTFSYSLKVPTDRSAYIKNYNNNPLGSPTGIVRVKSWFYSEWNGDIQIRFYGDVNKYVTLYFSNAQWYFYHGGGTYTNASGSYGTWEPFWVDIDMINGKVALWLDNDAGVMECEDGWFPAYNNDGQLDGFMTWESPQANTWLGPIEVVDISPVKITWDVEMEDTLTSGDYLTIMVPFLEVVDNSTNVKINIEASSGSFDESFWVAVNGPTDFALKSWSWIWADFTGHFTIDLWAYNVSRDLFIYDRNSKHDPDFDQDYNSFYLTGHPTWPDWYDVGFAPYCALQICNGSWENTHPPADYYLGLRLVDPDQVVKRSTQSDDLWIDVVIETLQRVTVAISFFLVGNMAGFMRALDFDAPFPTDAPWYLGKYISKPTRYVWERASSWGKAIWNAMVWIWEAIEWVVKYAPWFFAGLIKVLVLFIVIPLFAFCILAIIGVLKWGIILASQGVEPAMDYADEFWTNVLSRARSIAGRIPGVRRVVS